MPWFNGKQAQRIAQPPLITGDQMNALNAYLRDVASALNAIPRFSIFSGASPNSVISGLPGDLLINIGSASSTSRLWIKGGTGVVPTNTGWAVIRVLE